MRVFLWLAIFSGYCLSNCFDFSKSIRTPLSDLPLAAGKKEEIKWGAHPSGGVFGEIRTVVERAFDEVKKEFDDPMFTRNRDNTKVEIENIKSDVHNLLQVVHVTVTVFAFVTVSWDEKWAVDILEGGAKSPKVILYSYEKVAGTSHLTKKCGSIRLRKLSPKQTDVYWYEAVVSDRWDEQSAREHMVNTIQLFTSQKEADKAPEPASVPTRP